ncbi:MAG TPA: aminotransferase class V-fold PLP-dependent enzyme [Bryobacteraceae bacterium]|nr:aminotransferase class V-fold PLP-dependent enzyme [Bryobacteraceae bacterium]
MDDDSSRRGFLRGFSGGSSVAAAASLLQAKAAFAQSVKDLGKSYQEDWREDGGYWAKVRKQFLMEDGFAYLNTGTLGPTPAPVLKAMNEYWRLLAVNPNENSAIFQERQDQIRTKAALMVGALPDEIALTRNTTEGNSILAQGLDLSPGDEVLITQYEHNSNRETWMRQAKRFKLTVKEVKFPMPPRNPDVILNAFEAAITPRTRVMHFANPLGGYGCFMPVKQLAQLAHSKNILCFIDGAHATGMVQFSLKDWGVDGFACNSHKWLCGAAGAGILYVKQDIQDRIWPVIGIWRDPPKGARKYDQLSRRPWPCVAAFEDIIDFYNAVGPARIEQRARGLGAYLRRKASEIPKVKVYTPMDPQMSAGTSTIGIEGVPGARVKEHLRQKYDMYVPGGGSSVRYSTHYFNTFEQVERVLSALRDFS